MPVVSNTSPLLNLAIIGQLPLIARQFGIVLIPDAVAAELQLNSTRPGAVALKQAVADGWLQIARVSNPHLAQVLQLDLDRGESEAIALALEHGHTRILLDESEARAAATWLGLQPTGVLGILLHAKEQGEITLVKPLLLQLRQQAGFFIASTLHERILQAVHEND